MEYRRGRISREYRVGFDGQGRPVFRFPSAMALLDESQDERVEARRFGYEADGDTWHGGVNRRHRT